jgi:hypothetical protein
MEGDGIRWYWLVHGKGGWDSFCLNWEWLVEREYWKGGKTMVQYLEGKEVVDVNQEI